MNLRSFYSDHHGALLKMAGITGFPSAGMVLFPAMDLSCGPRQAFQRIFYRKQHLRTTGPFSAAHGRIFRAGIFRADDVAEICRNARGLFEHGLRI